MPWDASPGAGGEVDEGGEGAGKGLGRVPGGRDCLSIGDVHYLEPEPRAGDEAGDPALLQTDVVGVVQVVEPDDGVACVEQQLGHAGSDEPGGAGDEVGGHGEGGLQ
jgi:hypothetical protein